MKFDYTKGEKMKYGVVVHNWNNTDVYYFHYFREAKDMFEKLKLEQREVGTVISISDMQKDERKEFFKY